MASNPQKNGLSEDELAEIDALLDSPTGQFDFGVDLPGGKSASKKEKRGGISPLLIIVIVLFVLIVLGAVFFLLVLS